MVSKIEIPSTTRSRFRLGIFQIKAESIPARIGKVLLAYVVAFSLFGYYSFAASLAESGPRSAGYHNAGIVWATQRFLRLPSEAWLQRVTLPDTWLYTALDYYYTFAHFPISLMFVIWVAIVKREQWLRIAASLSVATFLCLTIDAVFPVAPPRLYTPIGVVDTLRRFGPDIYGTNVVHSIADQYGAMPSIHFGWSVFVAWGFIKLSPKLGIFRWLIIIHPLMTLAAVLLTGNHYWLDCIVAGLLISAAVWATDMWIKHSSHLLRTRMRRPALIASIPLFLFGLYNIGRIFF